jgi:hypothetical protein
MNSQYLFEGVPSRKYIVISASSCNQCSVFHPSTELTERYGTFCIQVTNVVI